MSTSIVILSPLPEARTTKAVNDCVARASALALEAPTLEVLTEHPDPVGLATLLEDDEDGLAERMVEVQSLVILQNEKSLGNDSTFVECLRFLLRRMGDAMVQFPEGVTELEVADMLIANFDGVEDFDEREEARRVHARLLRIKYRLLTQRWKRGDDAWAPRAIANSEIEAHERSARMTFPAEFRAYLAIVGVGPGPSAVGILPLDELEKTKTYAKTADRPKLGKTVKIGNLGSEVEHYHILVTDGAMAGTVWETIDDTLSDAPIADTFLNYIEAWIGTGEPELVPCPTCGVPLEVEDLERDYCQGCGARRTAGEGQSEASKAFEALATALLTTLIDEELLEIEDAGLFTPLVAALTEYMSEKGHKWKSPDKAAASIAGWLMHRDEVAELHGSNSDVARAFVAVAAG